MSCCAASPLCLLLSLAQVQPLVGSTEPLVTGLQMTLSKCIFETGLPSVYELHFGVRESKFDC